MVDELAEYENKVDSNIQRNEKYIKEFKEWLIEKGLTKKTISKHLCHVGIYVDDFLNYYDIIKIEDGTKEVVGFLDGWYARRCLRPSKGAIKEMAASLKKFYQFMSEKGYVKVEDYDDMCSVIKEILD